VTPLGSRKDEIVSERIGCDVNYKTKIRARINTRAEIGNAKAIPFDPNG
jgi:hypothetical protein